MKSLPTILTGAALLTILAVPSLRAADADEIRELREQLRRIEERLGALERRQADTKSADTPAANPAPKITVSDRGYTLASGDGANSLRLRGLVQLDSRLFLGDDGVANDAFVLRRARIISEGTLARHYSFQFVTEFGGGSASILDANLGLNLAPSLQLKVGKFKSPVGLEQLQSDSFTFFNERSIVTNLVPGRDLGIQASGGLAGGRFGYAVGLFNGVADGANSANTDVDNGKEVAGRVTVTPFRGDAGSPLQGLTLGLAGSSGRAKSAAGRTAGYRTDGQQTFFAYNAGVVADGRSWRISPQLDFRRGPFGLLGEYVLSTVNLRPSAAGAKSELRNTAWQLAAGYVLTGEDSSYHGVVPRTDFDRAAGTWGAFEITGRIATVDVDDAAFPAFATAGGSASAATSLGLGLNWYLSKAVALKLDCYRTDFDFAAGAPAVPSAPALRQDENVLITRFQLGF